MAIIDQRGKAQPKLPLNNDHINTRDKIKHEAISLQRTSSRRACLQNECPLSDSEVVKVYSKGLLLKNDAAKDGLCRTCNQFYSLPTD